MNESFPQGENTVDYFSVLSKGKFNNVCDGRYG